MKYKDIVISALYYYQNTACADEQKDCLNMFGYEIVPTDTDERATLFEGVIEQLIKDLE